MLDRILTGLERRSAPLEVYGAPAMGAGWLGFPGMGGRTDAGRLVSPDSALEAITVFGAISLIASAIGGLPLKVYRDADERLEARGSRQWRMLCEQPNPEMAADEFWELVTANLLGWGNAFLFKERDRSGVVQNLWPIRSGRVQVGRATIGGRSVRYFVIGGVDGVVYETDILHIRGLSYDGEVGYSPVQLGRQEIANALERDSFSGSFWRNGMFAGGVLTHPNRLSKDAQDRLGQQLAAKSGTSRAGELLVLEEAMTLQNLTMPLADAQFVEQSKLSDLKIAQLFGLVPPHMWGQGENSRSMTYTNSEFGGQEFVKWTARKWLTRIEKAVGADAGVFPAPGPTLFPEFDVTELLRTDMKSRWDAWAVGVENGWIDPIWVQEQEHIQIDRVIVPPPKGKPETAPAPLEAVPTGEPARALPAGQTIATRDRASLGVLDELRAIFRPEIHIDVPEQRAPSVVMRQDAPVVHVDMQPLAAMFAVLNGTLAAIRDAVGAVEIPAPVVNVQTPAPVVVPAPVVTVTVADEAEQLQIDFQRGPNGAIKSATVR